MARSVDEKLRLTAAILGAATRKDLAVHFRRINPRTGFDVDRASKWMQGRAQPRDAALYDDWVGVLALDRAGTWLADCEVPDFLDALVARHGVDAEALTMRARAMRREPAPAGTPEAGAALDGVFVSYSPSWSPYYRDHLIRGVLSIETGGAGRVAHYTENLPTATMTATGPVISARRALHLHLHDAVGDNHLSFCLFPSAPPHGVLAGTMTGAAIIGPEPQPTAGRVVMFRSGASVAAALALPPYLAPGRSVAADLAGLGFALDDPATVDRHIIRLLAPGERHHFDQPPAPDFRALLAIFDRHWLESPRL